MRRRLSKRIHSGPNPRPVRRGSRSVAGARRYFGLEAVALAALILLSPIHAQSLDEAMQNAARHGDLSALQPLLAKGTNVDARSPRGSTALMFAAEGGQIQTVNALLDAGADVNAHNNNGLTALMVAAMSNRLDVAGLLLTRGADVNAQGGPGTSPGPFALMLASIHGHVSMIELLATHKADLEQRNEMGSTALILAASYDQPDAVAALLALGADVNVRHSGGWNALMFAAQTNNVRAINLLLEKGARIRDTTLNGYSPLAVAAAHGNKEAVAALLAHHADPSDANALAEARKHGFGGILAMLEQKGGEQDDEVTEAIRDSQRAEAEALLKEGTNPTEVMLAAIDVGSAEPVRVALARGASPLAKYKDGITALARAEALGHTGIVAILKQAIDTNGGKSSPAASPPSRAP